MLICILDNYKILLYFIMPSTYLYLSQKNRVLGAIKWQNIPTISSSTRECYLSVSFARVVLDTGDSTIDGLTLKFKVPARNYFSTRNDEPVVCFLRRDSNKVYVSPDIAHDISLLTNDNLKSAEFVLEDKDGEVYELTDADTLEIMIKLDYVDQEDMTDKYLSQVPLHL